MKITLNGKNYRLVRDTSGRETVIVETGPRTSRIATNMITSRIIAGFSLPPIIPEKPGRDKKPPC